MIELSTLMHKVPYVTECKTVPCVWDITSFLTPFMQTTHDFGNVHHVWIHKSVEGTVSVNDNIFMQLLLNWLTLWKISKRQNTVASGTAMSVPCSCYEVNYVAYLNIVALK